MSGPSEGKFPGAWGRPFDDVPNAASDMHGQVAMGQNPNRTPSEDPNPNTKIGSKMRVAPIPKWYHWF